MLTKFQPIVRSIQKTSFVYKQERVVLINFQDLFRFQGFRLNSSLKDSKKINIPADNFDAEHFKDSEEHTWVGPPDHQSNLRLKVFPHSEKLTNEEKYFYLKSQETQDWNQNYWEAHNKEFVESRRLFIEKVSKERNLPKNETLTTKEMSQFYKQFLDSNYKKHIEYNWNWYKKNINLIFLAAKANVSKLKRLLKN